MNKSFRKIKEFVFSDIQREIDLAKISQLDETKEKLIELGITPGGGNFLSALALLCYTEFFGKFLKRQKGESKNKGDFERLFKRFGKYYESLLHQEPKIYDIFRNGMAHNYLVKESCVIEMLRTNDTVAGIGKYAGDKFWFNVEQYFDDFKKTVNSLEDSEIDFSKLVNTCK